jgi:hypothetical protein
LLKAALTRLPHGSPCQLLYSVLMTGYLFRNAQYRRELRRRWADAQRTREA